jgi:adenylosuccinate synthase
LKNLALVGLQWGDEGKGKLVDWISARFDLAVRYQGGPNAGHTVWVDGVKWVFHQTPAGVLNPNIHVAIAAGCVLHPQTLFEEWEKLDAAGVDYQSRTTIDPRTHIILPHHRLLDKLRDEARGKAKIGTTARGIGPCYEEKFARYGIRVGDLFSSALPDRLDVLLDYVNPIIEKIYDHEGFKKDDILSNLASVRDRMGPFVGDVSKKVCAYLEQGKKVLFEGAQGVLLDIDHGSYPYVTSSNPGTTSIPTGVGISPKVVDKVIGLTKAYATRVGAGPFPTEDEGEMGCKLQELGNEFGAATGRRRRCGWLDLPLLRYVIALNGVDGLAITKLDVLDSFNRLKVCTGYKQLDGSIRTEITPHDESPGEPVYEEIEGWQASTADARTFEELPERAQAYLEWISKQVETPLWAVSVGQERTATITMPDFPF